MNSPYSLVKHKGLWGVMRFGMNYAFMPISKRNIFTRDKKKAIFHLKELNRKWRKGIYNG